MSGGADFWRGNVNMPATQSHAATYLLGSRARVVGILELVVHVCQPGGSGWRFGIAHNAERRFTLMACSNAERRCDLVACLNAERRSTLVACSNAGSSNAERRCDLTTRPDRAKGCAFLLMRAATTPGPTSARGTPNEPGPQAPNLRARRDTKQFPPTTPNPHAMPPTTPTPRGPGTRPG